MMDFNEVFKKDNIGLVFAKDDEPDTFIAESGDCFSDLLSRGGFGRDWAWNFPAGRYVITVYQRHSVYENGERVWLNQRFENSVGEDSRDREPRFAIVLNHPVDYEIESWGRNLTSRFLRSEADPLQVETFDLEEAEAAASDLSADGHSASVLEWFEDYDMY